MYFYIKLQALSQQLFFKNGFTKSVIVLYFVQIFTRNVLENTSEKPLYLLKKLLFASVLQVEV